MPTVVSKTDYLLYRECPKNSWMKLHRPEIYYKSELSEFEKSIIETGNEVESVARKLFPTGFLIEGRDEKARKQTAELIEKREQTLFQPVFEKGNLLAACDILQFAADSKTWSLFEVKASNSIKEKLHLYDLAFQVNLLENCGVKIGTINLLHLNPEYIRAGELDIIKLFVIDNVTEDVRKLLESVKNETDEALNYLSKSTEPSGYCCCIYKGRSNHCATFSYSNKQVPEYSVHDIARIGVSKVKLTELIDSSIFHVHEVPEHIELSEIQRNQVDAALLDRITIKKEEIRDEFNKLVFPLYFLDYETFPSAIPRFDGFSPYQQIPFQYSLHIVDSANSTSPKNLRHTEFLYSESRDPSTSFIESLQKDIGAVGTIIVWNKKFECKINSELARRLPSYKNFIEGINSRVYDLMDIFSKQHYVHKDFKGSTSIKAILPVLVPELSYKNLEIQEGGTATQRWNELVTGSLSAAEKEKLAADLKKYCELDTRAMYEIWRHLADLI